MTQKILFVFLMMSGLLIGLNSCDNNYNSNWTDNTNELCQFTWVDYYLNQNAVNTEQQLAFNTDGSGVSTLITSPYSNPDTTILKYNWTWNNDGYFDKITISYLNGNYDYMSGITFGSKTLNCTLNGVNIQFQGIAR